MASLAEVRAKNPEYNDLTDEQLAQALHRKFYADMPFADFAQKVGLQPKPTAPVSTPDAAHRQDYTKPMASGGNVFQQISRAVTGEGQRQRGVGEAAYTSIPEEKDQQFEGPLAPVANALPQPVRNFLGAQQRATAVGVGFFLNPNERARALIIKRQVPSSQFRRDEYGNLQVRYREDQPWAYINRPGLSAEDAQTFANETGKFLTAERIPGLGASGGIIGTTARMGAAGAATSAAGQAASMPLGADEVNLGDVAASGAGAAAGNVIGRAVVAPAAKALSQTPAGKAINSVIQRYRNAGNSQAANAIARDPRFAAYAEADEFGIPLTRGQASGNVRQRQIEDDILTGAGTRGGQDTLDNFTGRQAEAIQEAGLRIATRGQAPLGENIEDAGSALQSSLMRRREVLEEMNDKAYEKAFAAAKAEKVTPSDELGARVDEVVNDVYLPNPRSMAIISKLQDNIAKGTATYAEVERARQALNRVAQAAANSGDAADLYAVQRVKNALDDWTRGSMKTPQARGTFDESREIYSELQQLYGQSGPKDIGGRTIEKAIDLERTGQQIAESILGRGQQPTPASLAAIRRLKQITTQVTQEGRMAEATKSGTSMRVKAAQDFYGSGPIPTELQAIREAYFRRMLSPLETRTSGKRMRIDGVMRNLEAAIDGPGAAITKEMFTEAEMATLRRYVKVLQRLVPPDGIGRSGTTQTAIRAVQNILGVVSEPLKDAWAYYYARRAITPNLAEKAAPAAMTSGIGFGAAGQGVSESQP